jgi:hypothetical protein
VDHGFVVFGQGLEVPNAAAVLADQGESALDHPPAGQDLEPGQVVGPLDDLYGQVEHLAGEDDQTASAAAVGLHVNNGREPFPHKGKQS